MIWVPDYEHYGGVRGRSLRTVGNLLDSWGPIGPMNGNNWLTTVLTLTTRHGDRLGRPGQRVGGFFVSQRGHDQGGTREADSTYLTWRVIPLPRRLVPVARRAHQPLVPPRQPGTYGNAAVARMMAGEARHHSSSTSTRRGATITTQLWPRTTCTTRATSVRSPAPSGTSRPRSPTTSPSSSPSTSDPQATAHSPHRRRPPKPQGLRALRHHLGPARHGAPGKNVQPKGRHNGTCRNTTRPQQPGNTRHRLPGGETCPATRIPQPQAPGPSDPSARCAHKRSQAQVPPATRLHNPKLHPTRPHATSGQRPLHRLTRSPSRTTARQSNRRRAPHTHTV